MKAGVVATELMGVRSTGSRHTADRSHTDAIAHLLAIGVDYRSTPIGVRENAALVARESGQMMRYIVGHLDVTSCMMLSTCNRTELYLIMDDPEAGDLLIPTLAELLVGEASMTHHVQTFVGEEALQHLFRVAAGLESVALGEPQILGQLKDAAQLAQQNGTLFGALDLIIRQAISAGKRIRTETPLGSRARSLSDLAIDVLAGQGRISEGTTALVIGAGTMGSIAAARLHAHGARVSVLSRTRASQNRLAEAIGGTPVSWETVPEACSIIIAATSDADYILTPERLGNILPSLDHDLLIVDLAMPRDVDPLCALLPHVEVIDIDTIAKAGTASILTREDLDHAQALLAEEVAHTVHIHEARSVSGPTIQHLTEWAEELRADAVDRGLRTLGDDTVRAHVDALTKRIVKQLLHPVIQKLHDDADDPEIAHIIHELFPHSRPGTATGEE